MPTKSKPIATCDCETDPFLYERVPEPFLWGYYDGKDFLTFYNTKDFVDFVKPKKIILYAHNGGKFDFIYFLPYIEETKAQVINGRIVSIMLGQCELRDSLAAVPVSMKEIQKEEIQMWKLEKEVRHEHMEEILFRNKTDCVYLYNLMAEYRRIAGKHKTIASNALSFAKRQGINVGKTNHNFDDKYRKFFFGGRTQVFNGGTHHNISVLDIHSAYPFAMLHNHPTGSNFRRTGTLQGLSTEQIQRSFIEIECYSNGAFPAPRKSQYEGLNFPQEFGEYHVTGWEYLVAKEFNLISDENILSVRYTDDFISFHDYVNHWYEWKRTHPKSEDIINYTIGKIMMNSLYGKLAQNPARYYDYKFVPAGTPTDPENGWKACYEYADHEIHRRESLWKYKYELGVEWRAKPIYYNVATASSITGFTRAHLLRAVSTIGFQHIIYTDTDSIICGPDADLSSLSMTDALGDWELEYKNCPIGHFAGKKLYGFKLPPGAKPVWNALEEKHVDYKIACKGSKLSWDHIEHIINGGTVTWKNSAPSFKIDGTADFVVREIRATAKPSNFRI